LTDASVSEEGCPALSPPFEPAAFCPSGQPIAGPVPVIPRPRQVFHLAEPAELASPTLGICGAEQEERDYLMERLDGLPVTEAAADFPAALSITFHGVQDWWALLDTCALSPGESPEAYFLHVGMADGRTAAHVLAPDPRGRFHAVKTLAQLLSGRGSVSVRAAVVLDRPALGQRALIEGFYGPPWTQEARLGMVREAAALKLNTFVFAPKSAELTNAAWMMPFSPQDLEEIREVVEQGRRGHVQICWEMRPSWAFHYSSQTDFDTLMGKLEAIVAEGVDCLILSFDDVPPTLVPPDDSTYSSYTEAQADFLPRLSKALLDSHPGLTLAFVPVEYYTSHPDAATAWPLLGAALPAQWEIAWTGTQIGSSTVTLDDALAAAALMGRPPMLGDNYPVSDDAQVTGLVHLGPLVGRSPDLWQGLAGIGFNAMPLAYASLPALATAADYAWNPEAYAPADSAAQAARLLGGEGGAAALLTLAMANRSPMLEGNHAPELAAALDDYWAAWSAGADLGPAEKTLEEGFFEPFSAVPAGFQSDGFHAALALDLAPWATVLGDYGENGHRALTLLAAVAASGLPPADELAALEAAVQALTDLTPRPTGPIMLDFLAHALEEIEAPRR
jgi:hyaluronoglucosaminidase